MNNTERAFLMMLKNYIDEQGMAYETGDVDYEELIELSRNHRVEAIIYDEAVKSGIKDRIPQEILSSMKFMTIYSSACQIRNKSMLENIFKELNKNDIQFIGLKGVVLRSLYKKPEYRSMCDVDIVVHKHNLDRVKDIFGNLGYKIDVEDSPYHLRFTHMRLPVIEVHWEISGNEELDQYGWNTSSTYQFGQAVMLELNSNMMLFHMICHMAHHMEGLGFGIRQLMDFAIYIRCNYEKIDFTMLKEMTQKKKIFKFTSIIFALSSKVFGTDVPDDFYSKDIKDSFYLDEFLMDILTGGIYGRSSETRMIASSININFDEKNSGKVKSFINKISKIISQKDEAWLDDYPVAKKHKPLRWIAAVKYLYRSRFNTEKGLVNNIKELGEASRISKGQKAMRDWLELKG